MRQRLVTPSHLIHLGGLHDLKTIEYDENNGLCIGAFVCHGELADAAAIKKHYPMLASMAMACGQSADPQYGHARRQPLLCRSGHRSRRCV